MKLADFKPGMKVIYTPFKNCPERVKEHGTVKSVGEYYVFVDYAGRGMGVATNPLDLTIDDEN